MSHQVKAYILSRDVSERHHFPWTRGMNLLFFCQEVPAQIAHNYFSGCGLIENISKKCYLGIKFQIGIFADRTNGEKTKYNKVPP